MQSAESFLRAHGGWWQELDKGIYIMIQTAGVTELDQEDVESVNYLIFFGSFQKSYVVEGFFCLFSLLCQ